MLDWWISVSFLNYVRLKAKHAGKENSFDLTQNSQNYKENGLFLSDSLIRNYT